MKNKEYTKAIREVRRQKGKRLGKKDLIEAFKSMQNAESNKQRFQDLLRGI
jgi:hypothetical protein